MLRFAPSPTGDMNIGDLRVALFNYIVSKQKKEDFVVRIEDIDKEKTIEGKDQEILDLLALFGIEYSQVIHQSQNVKFHTAMALQLLQDKKAFSCFCSDEWLEGKRNEAKANNIAYQYDEACANLPDELVIDNLNPFRVRIKKPIDASNDIDSFIIMHQDKTPTYDFACAIDDMLSDISIIIRDESYVLNAAKQEHIRSSLGYDKQMQYFYLPNILNTNESSNIKWLLEQGFLPEAISNYLISTCISSPKEIFTIEESIEWLSLDDISKSPITFSIEALRDINLKHLLKLDAKELSRYVGFADEEIGKLARVYLTEVSTTKELKAKIAPIFAQKNIPDEFKEQSELIIETIKSAPFFDKYDDFKNYIMEKSDLEDKSFSKVFRYVLTGAGDGPDIVEIYKYLKNYIAEIVK